MNYERVAILCNGRSLKDVWPEEHSKHYECIIGVNTSAWLYGVDYHAFLDKNMFSDTRRIKPLIGSICVKKYRKSEFDLEMDCRIGKQQCNYTFPSTINTVVKHLLKPGGVIDVFGMDCSNVKTDVAGYARAGDSTHHNSRWTSEIAFLKGVWSTNINVFGLVDESILEWLEADNGVDWAAMSKHHNKIEFKDGRIIND